MSSFRPIPYLKSFALFYVGCVCCLLLQRQIHLSAIIASAIVGLIASFAPGIFALPEGEVQALLYSGSFAGMCSEQILSTHSQVLFLSLVGAAIFIVAKPHFKGMGGKMGAIAFVSSLFLLGLKVFV
jgi:hypothetical protein